MSAFVTSTPLRFSTPSSLALASCVCRRRGVLVPQRTSRRPVRHDTTASLVDATVALSANPAALTTVADAFGKLGLPSWLVEWGHPGMMAFLVLGMGAPGALIGWKGRLNEDKREGVKQKGLHENIMLAFFLLAFLGGTGGTLSVAMQGYDVWESPHFKSAALVLFMLGANSILAYTGFTIGSDGSAKGRLQGRKVHAYFGAATMVTFLVHGFLGAKILLG